MIVRFFLFSLMVALCVAEYFAGASLRFLYFTNWGVYLTTIVTGLQFACAVKYKMHLDKFNIKLKNIQENISAIRDEDE